MRPVRARIGRSRTYLLSVLSKLLERLVARQLREYLLLTDLLPPLQSGFRQGHFTETALLRVLSDILQAVDRGDLAALVLLECQQLLIVDTADHSIMLERLQRTFGIGDTALHWFQSYPSSRKQYVRRSPNVLSVTYLVCGVPHGSVLGPILFVLYTVDLEVTDNYGLSAHMYADNTQVYGFCRPTVVSALTANITDCIEASTSWTRSNKF